VIVVTGAMGFIGSGLIGYLNRMGRHDLIAVDDFYQWKKEPNLAGKRVHDFVHRDLFIPYFEKIASNVDAVFHIGARTDTISDDTAVFDALNLRYSQAIWRICAAHGIPLVYASSAATYGDGTAGFRDEETALDALKPLNAYAWSKHQFDQWVVAQEQAPPRWYGLKFFNVYGPNEYHKGRMASVIFHAFHQIRQTGSLKLFKSHRPEYADGGQMRDFIYVRDILDMVWHAFAGQAPSGIYNAGTGTARTFADLGQAIFAGLGLPPAIEYIDMPEDLRDRYQYFTEADMRKWAATGLPLPGTSIEDGVGDYVREFLVPGKYL
jgi:ADP-L-glycero-D-manno-heptose 6-epimerase